MGNTNLSLYVAQFQRKDGSCNNIVAISIKVIIVIIIFTFISVVKKSTVYSEIFETRLLLELHLFKFLEFENVVFNSQSVYQYTKNLPIF